MLTSEFDFVASGSTYETVDLRTGFSASRSLPAAATSIRSVGNTAFFSIVASPYLVMHQPGASDLAISLPAASAGLHPHQNLLFVALQGGGVVEVIATSGTISRQLPSCSPSLQLGGTQIGSGPLVSVGPGTLALACSNSAVDFIDLSTGSSSVLSLPPAAPDPHLITGISGSDAPGATLLLSLTIAQQSFVEFLTSGTANVLDTSNPGIVASDQAVVNAGADSYVTNGSVVQHVHFANRKISGAPILGSGGAETRNGRIAIVSGLATTNGLGVYFLDTASGAVVGQPNVLPAPTGMPP